MTRKKHETLVSDCSSLDSPISGIPFDDFSGRFSNNISESPDVRYRPSFGLAAKSRKKSATTRDVRETTTRMPRSWVPEILASILAICALLGIVGVLRACEGRGTDQTELPGSLTLNGLLALLGTVLRVLLLVPLGSAISQEGWLWLATNSEKRPCLSHLRDLSLSDAASRGAWGSFISLFFSWRRPLAIVGAIIMILCLAIDTFTQQLISSAGTAVKDKTSALNPGNIPWAQYYGDFQGNPAEAAFGPTLDIRAAAYNGFLAKVVKGVEPDCATGNCTFPSTPSIAVCGACSPTTNSLSSCNATSCNYTTSTGTTFSMANWNSSDIGIGFRSQPVFPNISYPAAGNLTIVDFETLGAPYQSLADGLYGSFPTWSSHKCQFQLCVNTYDTFLTSGQMFENIIATYSEVSNPGAANFSGGSNWTFIGPNATGDNGIAYNVSYLGMTALAQQLSNMVSGTATLNLEGYSTSSDAIEAVWNGTQDMQAWAGKVALSLTNAVRQSTPASRSQFDGVAYELSIVVRWAWIALPVSLTALTIALLLFVMIRTTRSEIGSWKGSPLTMLLFDVDRDLRQHVDDVDWNGFSSGTDSHLSHVKICLQKLSSGRFRLKTVDNFPADVA